MNHLNRGEYGFLIGAVAADKRFVALVATKKLRIHKMALIDTTIIAASESNYVEMKLIKNNVDVDVLNDTVLGIAARTEIPMSLDASLDYLDLEKGDVLEVDLNVEGSGALTMASLLSDIEVIGN